MELRLLRGGSSEVGRQWLDICRRGWVNSIDDVVTGWDTLVGRGPVDRRWIQATQVDLAQRVKGRNESVAGNIFVVQRLLEDGVGHIGLGIAELKVTIWLLLWIILGDILEHLRHARHTRITPGRALTNQPAFAQQRHQCGNRHQRSREGRALQDPLWEVTQLGSGADDPCRGRRNRRQKDILRASGLHLGNLRREVGIVYSIRRLGHVIQIVRRDRFRIAFEAISAVIIVLIDDAGSGMLHMEGIHHVIKGVFSLQAVGCAN